MNSRLKSILLLMLMIGAAAGAYALRPTQKIFHAPPVVDLEGMIPRSFGDWTIDESVIPVQASEDRKARLDALYSLTLARTYGNSGGKRVMLAIAYGDSQTRTLQVHRPEVCYASQGFATRGLTKDTVAILGESAIPVMRLVSTQGNRIEPITYWVRFGHDVVRGNLEQGFSRLRHGLRGEVPDALLFRVSTLSPDPERAYAVQDAFVRDLIANIDPQARTTLLGEK